MTTLRLLLGDQLNASHSWFRERRDDVVYVLMEVRSETDYVRHHAQKVLAIFAAMREFAAALQSAGHRLHYLCIGDPLNQQSFIANLHWLAAQYGATAFERQEADEWRLEQALIAAQADLGLPASVVSSEHFLADRQALAQRFADKVPRMEFFYREMRKRYRLLLDADGQPHGGQWNYDAENRDKWPGSPAATTWLQPQHDLSVLWDEIVAAGIATLGEPHAASLNWPLSRREARVWLAHFITNALPHFGQFQDAMSRQSRTLFHSGLSFALNTKMLQPMEVIDAAINAYEAGKATLAATEGFVRQILGWREYVRGIYWARMPGYAKLNALAATRPLPAWYWTGDTRMACLQQAISQSLETAYAHHIQRLMVTGNFALLAGCDPDDVDAWYLGIYIDAFEWVELPNTRGMSQFADGGVLASKPYCGSASYMQRQGDYCKGCAYQPKRRHGEGACPLNSLYWHFHVRHADVLGRNPRLAMPYKAWSKLDPAEQAATLAQAEVYLAQLDTL